MAGKITMDKEKAIIKLSESFQYDESILEEYLDSGLSYTELRNICMHAYFSQKPLSEVAELRKKYIWTKVKYLLGLTAEKFAMRELEYKADRLHRLFGIDKELTMKYMKMGYASHQIKRAFYISQEIDMKIEEILALKTRQKSWGDICEELGLPRDACMK